MEGSLIRAIAAASAALPLVVHAQAHAQIQTQESSRPIRAFKTVLTGDLDTSAGAKAFANALELARAQDAVAVVELSPRHASVTTAHEFIRLAKDRKCRLLVVLPFTPEPLHPSSLALALIADEACIPDGLSFRSQPDPTAPDDDRIRADIRRAEAAAWLAPRLKLRGIDEDLAPVLMGAPGRAFVMEHGHVEPWHPAETSPASGLPLSTDDGVEIRWDALQRLGLAPCDKKSQGLFGGKPLKILEVAQEPAGTAEFRRELDRDLSRIALLLDRVRESLNPAATNEHRTDGLRLSPDSAAQTLEEAERWLQTASKRLDQVPEIGDLDGWQSRLRKLSKDRESLESKLRR